MNLSYVQLVNKIRKNNMTIDDYLNIVKRVYENDIRYYSFCKKLKETETEIDMIDNILVRKSELLDLINKSIDENNKTDFEKYSQQYKSVDKIIWNMKLVELNASL